MTHKIQHTNSLHNFWNMEEQARLANLDTKRVTLLFSGGQDSMVALWLLHHTARTRAYGLRVLHYNHLWQHDNFFMANHAAQISFWLHWQHWTAIPTCQINSEYSASRWRMSMNTRLTSPETPSIIVNGHTQSDQHESMLFTFMRTLTGQTLTSERAHTNAKMSIIHTTVTRPLRALRRHETGFIVHTQHLPIYPDTTNIACKTTRAQIRYIILPLLTKIGFGPSGYVELPGTRTQN